MTAEAQAPKRREEALARHLSGIQDTLLSVAKMVDSSGSDRSRVSVQLEWAASYLNEAVRELGCANPGSDQTDGSPAPWEGSGPASSLVGTNSSISAPEVLGFVSSLRKSGVLHIDGQHETFKIELKDGAAVHAESSSPPKGQLLGDVLVDQGAIERDELEDVISRNDGDPRRLGRLLLDEELISHDQLRIALSFHVQLLFHRMCEADDARFRFEEGACLEAPEDDVRLNVTSLLLESARASDERARS